MKTLGKLGLLKKRSEFLYVRDGRYEARGGVVIQARPNPDHNTIRAGFTATKKIGNAVIRNRAKRRLRAVCLEVLPPLSTPGTDYVFIARNSTVQRPYELLLDDARKALLSLAKPQKNHPKNQKEK